jgi:phospholipid/cholesterol/gamma-HCH transport system substrate-binding protein
MPHREKRTELLVGLFLFIGLFLLGALTMQYGRFTDRLGEVYTVTVEFKDASGVIKGSHVKLGGAKIGEVVEQPQLVGTGKINVVMCIREDSPQLPKNAVFQITSLSILGDKAIVVSSPVDETPSLEYIVDGDVLVGGGAGGLEALQGDAVSIAQDTRILMGNARTTLLKIDAALDDVRSVAGRLTASVEQINHGLLSDENIDNLSESLASLKETTQNIELASQEIGPVIQDAKKTIVIIGNAAEEAQMTFAKANTQIDQLGPALAEVPAVMTSLSKTADELGDAVVGIREGEGLLGALAYDREVKEDGASFLKNLRRYGILGYRDESTFDERDPRNRYRGSRR